MLKNALRFTVPSAVGILALLLLAQAAQQRPAAPASARQTVQIRRAPARVIKDPNSSFSAVAVDVAHNEIILQDENLAQIMVYGREDNTPPRASLTEPKRIIGGSATKVAMN